MIKAIKKTLALLIAGVITAQASAVETVNPKLDWQIYETEHFRIHYTPEYKDWTLVAAHEMEQSREILKQQQQRTLEPKVDVVVFDPLNDSNGFALPFSTKPFMALFTTPPLSDSVINNSTSWPQLLALHEYAHLLHLAQPERSNWRQRLRQFYDLFDIASAAMDRWVAEGYATLLESKLTGRGRLFDVQVEAMMQQFAREGAWPKYGELNNTSGKYKLGAMAYLVGGRFLHWLEQNYSEQTLDAVWTRMRGSENRGFDKAFKGVFNREPEYLYQRFVAEYTQKVMNSETMNADERLWLDGEFEMVSPSLSRDQSKLLVVEKSKRSKGHVYLNVYETAENTEAKEKFDKQNKEILEADPLDIVDSEPLVFNKKRLHQLHQINGKGIRYPRWRSEDEILYIASTQDSHGAKHQDLFSWQLSNNRVIRLSTGLNVRRFDVSDDGNTLIAERNYLGESSLIQLDLTQSIEEENMQTLLAGGIKTSFDFPRLNPRDAAQLLYLSRKPNQPWQLKLRNLASDAEQLLPMPEGYQYLSYVQWANDGNSVYFVAGSTDKLYAYEYDLPTKQLARVTQGHTPIAWPMEFEQEGEASLLYASYRSTGPNLYQQPLAPEKAEPVADLSDQTDWSYLERKSTSPILMPAAIDEVRRVEGQHYPYNSSQGSGRQEVTLALSGTSTSASTSLWEVAVKGGDLMKRLNWLVNASADVSNDSANGVSAYVNWQGWPVNVAGNFYYFELDPMEQATSVNSAHGDYAGFNLDLSLDYGLFSSWLETYRGEVGLKLSHNEQRLLNFPVEEHRVATLSHRQSWSYDNQNWAVYQSSEVSWLQGGNDVSFLTEEDTWTGHQGSFSLGLQWQRVRLTSEQRWLVRNDHEYSFVRMGGMESNLIASRNLPNWVFIPELPFGTLTGDEFNQQSISLSMKDWPQLYYSDVDLDDRVQYDIYGVKDDFTLNFLRAGLTDWHVGYGVAAVIDQRNEETIQGWISLRYQY